MRINSVYFNKFNLQNQSKENKNSQMSVEFNKNIAIGYAYKDFLVSFGDRLNRTPEDFYEQSFNRENMPKTAKEYLFENYEERRHMPPAQLQRESYQYLTIADTVQDIKDMYPNEPLFDGLRTLDETRPSVGTLLMLKWDKQISNTPIFKNPENKDLTVYLLKKVYLEGKTIEEINKDFDKDATDAIKKELGIDDKKYFSSTNLRTLGIRYPKLPYYNSFLATRNDKEYIPPVRTSSTHSVSEATRQKLSESTKTWWAGLNELERMEQIQKMMNGKEFADSVFDRFKGPIMTLAAARMNFSEKLSAVFADKLSDEAFKEKFPSFEEQQREIMLEFWNKDPEFRKNYSIALKSIIADFDFAYHEKENPEYLEDLLDQALNQKARILENAKLRRRENSVKVAVDNTEQEKTSQKEVERVEEPEKLNETPVSTKKIELTSREIGAEFVNAIRFHLRNHSKVYRGGILNYMQSRAPKSLKLNIIAFSKPNPKDYLGDVDLDETWKDTVNAFEMYYKKFDKENPLLSRANNIVIASDIYDVTGDLKVFRMNNFQLSAYPLSEENKVKLHDIRKQQSKTVESLAVLASRENTRELYQTSLYPEMIRKLNFGFDSLLFGDDDEKVRKETLQLIERGLVPDTDETIKELQKYNAPLSFVCDEENNNEARIIVFERVMHDLLNWQVDNLKTEDNSVEIPKNARVKYQNPKTLFTIMSAIRNNKLLDIDGNSTASLKVAFGKLLHDEYLKYFDEDFQMKFIDYAISHPILDKDRMISCMFVNTGAIENYNRRLTPGGKDSLRLMSKETIKVLVDDYRKLHPKEVNSREFALRETFANLTDKNRVDIWVDDLYTLSQKIKAENCSKELEKHKYSIQNLVEKCEERIPKKELLSFYENYFKKTLDVLKEQNAGKPTNWNVNFNKTVLEIDKRLSRTPDTELGFIFEHLQRNRAAYEYVNNRNNPVNSRRTVMMALTMDYVDKRSYQIYPAFG